MKFFSLALVAGLASMVSAGYNGKAVASAVDKHSKKLKPGQYRFVNVASHKGLKYSRNGQSLYAASGKGDWLSIKNHEHHVVISPSKSNNKCLSAAWSYTTGSDSYGALYACSVAHFKKRGEYDEKTMKTRSLSLSAIDMEAPLEKRGTMEKRTQLRGAKQYFYVHPASQSHTWHIVAYDHITDMKTRVVSDSAASPSWAKGSKWSSLQVLNEHNKHQEWYIYGKNGKRV